MSIPEQSNFGSFIPTTQIWDSSAIDSMDVKSPEFKQLIVELYTNMGLMARILNTKESGFYYQQEFVNGNIWFPNPLYNSTTQKAPTERPEFHHVVLTGALLDNAPKSVAHGLTVTSGYRSVSVYGGATNPSTSLIPLPYASPTLADNISVEWDATNVIITTGNDRTAYTDSFVVLRFIKE